MRNFLYKTKPLVLVLIMSVALLNTSCDKENIDERPELPPIESMKMDFTDFQSAPAGVKSLDTKDVTDTYVNFTYAYTNAAFWNAFTTVSLAIPVMSYGYALQQEPEYAGNSTWKWSYDFTLNQMDYTATLTGKRIDNEEFSMKMNIALASLPAIKFTYFDGICRYDHTHAEWNLYKNDPTSPVKVLEVEWDKDFVTDVASLRYTYVEPGMEETDSYILWTYTPGSEYDAGYFISLSTGDVDIEWDTYTKAGHVMSPYYFEDSVWHCWNDVLADIDCPVE